MIVIFSKLSDLKKYFFNVCTQFCLCGSIRLENKTLSVFCRFLNTFFRCF